MVMGMFLDAFGVVCWKVKREKKKHERIAVADGDCASLLHDRTMNRWFKPSRA
jgi:hypothetical protein